MNVTDVFPADCEPESIARAWSSRGVSRAQACWPGDIHVKWPQVGELRVKLSAVAPLEHPHGPAASGLCESFSLWRKGRPGRLDVDARFAACVISGMMGLGANLPMARLLSPGERGLFAALLASTLERVKAPLHLAIEIPDAVPVRLEIQVELDLRFVSEAGSVTGGWARLFLPASWLDSGAAHWRNLARVPFPAVVELARTTVDRSSLAALAIGDGLAFSGVDAFASEAETQVWLSLGAFRAPARVTGEILRLAGSLEACPSGLESTAAMPIASAVTAWKGTTAMTSTVEMSPGAIAAGATEAPAGSLAQALANTPVEVVAEVGRLVLTGAELAGLGDGQVLALGGLSRGGVTLSVAGRPVAKGVLVNLDGSFGVRVTERF